MIKIGGIPITTEIDGIKKAGISEDRKNANGFIGRKLTGELTFYPGPDPKDPGDAYRILKAAFIDHPNGRHETLDFKYYSDCCHDTNGQPYLFFDGELRGDSINFCDEDCYIKCSAFEKTRKADCIRSTLIFDDALGFQSQEHPKFPYCIEYRPGILQAFVLSIIATTYFAFLPLKLIVAILSVIVRVICKIVDLVGGDCPDELEDGILDDYNEFWNKIIESGVGCGRKQPAPLVRDYINNVCNICNQKAAENGDTSPPLQFKSSILNDPASEYFNTCFLFAPIKKGRRKKDFNWENENRPIYSLTGFLDLIKDPFSADYNIIEDKLIFEREDTFYTDPALQWVDYTHLKNEGRISKFICYSYSPEENPSYLAIKHADDPTDWVGNEAREIYDYIQEWNSPYRSTQKGALEKNFQFGRSRYRNDDLDDDIISAFDKVFQLFPKDARPSNYAKALLLNNGTCNMPKLLAWDGQSRAKAYVVKNDSIPGKYNYPFHFTARGTQPDTAYPSDQPGCDMYGRFWAWKNPRTSASRKLRFEFSFNYTCEELRSYRIYKTVNTPEGTGIIENAEIRDQERTIKITGRII